MSQKTVSKDFHYNIQDWIYARLSRPSKSFAGLPPCPYAKQAWLDDKGIDQEGCNELLNATLPDLLTSLHDAYANAGADLIKTNTFGTMPWVLDEYDMGKRSYELSTHA